jgi:cytochrome b6-f complex iron-sulfur subunit
VSTLLFTLGGLALTLLALLTLGWFNLRRRYTAAALAGIGPSAGAPLPACDLGGQLMAAVGTPQRSDTPGSGNAPGGGGTPGRAGGTPRRRTGGGPNRRSFLRNAWLAVTGIGLAGFSGASLGFLWPNLAGGFGSEIDVDDEQTIIDSIRTNRSPFAYPAGRMWITTYDPALDPEGEYHEVTDDGNATLMALYQRCVHLGCRVPFNVPPQRFQCPCHGSNYNPWGEYILGPAPRGLDRFPLRIENGRVLVDTATIVTGPSRGTNFYRET